MALLAVVLGAQLFAPDESNHSMKGEVAAQHCEASSSVELLLLSCGRSAESWGSPTLSLACKYGGKIFLSAWLLRKYVLVAFNESTKSITLQ